MSWFKPTMRIYLPAYQVCKQFSSSEYMRGNFKKKKTTKSHCELKGAILNFANNTTYFNVVSVVYQIEIFRKIVQSWEREREREWSDSI